MNSKDGRRERGRERWSANFCSFPLANWRKCWSVHNAPHLSVSKHLWGNLSAILRFCGLKIVVLSNTFRDLLWRTDSSRLMTGCIATIWTYDGPPKKAINRKYSKSDIFPTPPVRAFWIFNKWLIYMAIYSVHCHVTAIYKCFASVYLQFLAKKKPQQWLPCLFNTLCKKDVKNWVWSCDDSINNHHCGLNYGPKSRPTCKNDVWDWNFPLKHPGLPLIFFKAKIS